METQNPNESAKPETQPTQTASDGHGQATPRPWEVGERAFIKADGDGDIFEGGDWNIYPPMGEAGPVALASSEANAKLIVAAVNAYAQRVPQTQDSQQPACASSVPPKADGLQPCEHCGYVIDILENPEELRDPKCHNCGNPRLKAKSGSGSLGTEIAEKWVLRPREQVGYADIYTTDGKPVVTNADYRTVWLVTAAHNASLSAVPAQKEGEVGDETQRTNTGSDSKDLRHTPGPWCPDWGRVRGAQCETICIAPDYQEQGHGAPIHPQWEADRCLIAAAPDLLEALEFITQRWVSMVDSGDCGQWNADEDECVIKSRAAIAKAQAVQNV